MSATNRTPVSPQLEYAASVWHPHSKTQSHQIESAQWTVSRWTCRRWRNTSHVGEKLDELQCPASEARQQQAHKIHIGTVSIDYGSPWRAACKEVMLMHQIRELYRIQLKRKTKTVDIVVVHLITNRTIYNIL